MWSGSLPAVMGQSTVIPLTPSQRYSRVLVLRPFQCATLIALWHSGPLMRGHVLLRAGYS